MGRNVMGELEMCRQSGTTPNYSEIARRYGLDRHTVAKYWRGGPALPDGRSDRCGAFDAFAEEVAAKATLPGVTKRAIYEWLLDAHGEEGMPGYNAFTAWCRARGVTLGPAAGPEPHPRFETAPGVQMQFDWKEGLSMHDRSGEEFSFNVFSATLSWSRAHVFVYARTRTTDDLLACLLTSFVRLGGIPQECVTDNMSALVTFAGGRRVRSERAWRFAREAGFDLQLCAPRSPMTKGKDESANRFVNRLAAYERDFDGEEGIVAAIARIEGRCNADPNRETGLPPAALSVREKEQLRPIGNLSLLESMVGDVSVQVVPPTMLVRALGRQWSVPRRCIGRSVRVISMPGGQVRVTMGGETVAVHDSAADPGRRVNYDPAHYEEAISGKARFADSDIREAARRNLELIDSLGRES